MSEGILMPEIENTEEVAAYLKIFKILGSRNIHWGRYNMVRLKEAIKKPAL